MGKHGSCECCFRVEKSKAHKRGKVIRWTNIVVPCKFRTPILVKSLKPVVKQAISTSSPFWEAYEFAVWLYKKPKQPELSDQTASFLAAVLWDIWLKAMKSHFKKQLLHA